MTKALATRLPGEGDLFTVERYQSREAWLSARRTGIGGSEAAGLWTEEIARAGQVAPTTPLAIYASKTTEDDAETTRAMRLGQLFEPVIAQLYAEETGRAVATFGDEECKHVLFRSIQWPWMIVTPDRQLRDPGRRDPGILETKKRSLYSQEDWTEAAPFAPRLQVGHALAITGWQWGACVALVGDFDLRHYDVTRQDRWIAAHVERCRVLWQAIQDRDPPAPIDHPADGAAVGRVYPDAEVEAVELPDSFIAIAQTMEQAKEDAKAAYAVVEWCEARLRHAIGNAEIGVLPNGTRYSLKTTERPGYTVAPTSYRVLRKMKRS